jgi:hypothetical protein
MKKIFIILLTIIPILVLAEFNYQDYLKSTPGLEEYPNAYAINVLTKVEMEIAADGSYDKHVSYLKKILTYKGKKKYSDISIVYDANHETIELGDCFTIDTEGNKIDLPKEAVHDSEHSLTVQSPEYINLRETIINMPAIEPGFSIVVNYTIHNKRQDYVGGIEHMMEENPYLKKRFQVTLPEGEPFYYDFPNDVEQLSFEKVQKDGNDVYTWKIEDSNFILAENNSPSLLITGCPIVYSTAKNWQELGGFLQEKFESNLVLTNKISEQTATVLEGLQSKKAKLTALYNYLAENYIIKPANLVDQSFVSQPPQQTFVQKYGSERDLIALFLTMAKAANIQEIYPAVILAENNMVSNLQVNNAVRNFFSQMAVYWEGKLLRIGDDKMPFLYAGVENANVLVLKEKPELVKYSYSSGYLVEKEIECDLQKTGSAQLSYKNIYHGSRDYQFRRNFKNEPPQKRMIWFAQNMSDKSSFIIQEPEFLHIDELEKPLQIHYATRNDDFYVEQDEFIYFKLPAAGVPLQVSLNTRTTPFQNYEFFTLKETFVVQGLPEDYELLKPQELSEVFEDFNYNVQVEQSAGQLLVTRTIHFPQSIIPVQNYADFKKFISKLKQPLNMMVFVKK